MRQHLRLGDPVVPSGRLELRVTARDEDRFGVRESAEAAFRRPVDRSGREGERLLTILAR
jgi:hypothetical protein